MNERELEFCRSWVRGYGDLDEGPGVARELLVEVDRLRAQVAAVEAEVDTWNSDDVDEELGAAEYFDNAPKAVARAEALIRKALKHD